jgi:glycosyltransferase involved in cell wall biosynthesis
VISVITITYNNFEELLKTLNSLTGVSGVESVVVNGGNCERTYNFLKNYPGVVINEKDKGISDAFNKGAKAAHGEAIAYLNSGDILIDPLYFQTAEELLSREPAYSYVYADLLFDDPLAGKVIFKKNTPTLDKIGRGMPFAHPTVVIRTTAFSDVGDFNLNYKISMDYEWAIRLIQKGHVGKYIQKVPVLMDGNGVSSTGEQKALYCTKILRKPSIKNLKKVRLK